MTHRLLSILSLLLLLAAASLCVRSFWRNDRVEWVSTRLIKSGWVGHVYEFDSLHGMFCFEYMRADFLPGHQPPEDYRDKIRGPFWYVRPAIGRMFPQEGPLRRLRIGVRRFAEGNASVAYRQTDLIVPYWLPLLLFSALPASLLLRYVLMRKRRRVLAGLCPECGYDLRASPERCPECGTPAPHGEFRHAT